MSYEEELVVVGKMVVKIWGRESGIRKRSLFLTRGRVVDKWGGSLVESLGRHWVSKFVGLS